MSSLHSHGAKLNHFDRADASELAPYEELIEELGYSIVVSMHLYSCTAHDLHVQS